MNSSFKSDELSILCQANSLLLTSCGNHLEMSKKGHCFLADVYTLSTDIIQTVSIVSLSLPPEQAKATRKWQHPAICCLGLRMATCIQMYGR